MFHSISWVQYWTFVIVAVCIYYLVIYALYFRGIINGKLSGNGRKSFAFVNSEVKESQNIPSLFDQHNNDFNTANDNEEYAVNGCMDEFNAFFENQKKTKAVKSEVMFALHAILRKYPSLRSSEYKEAVTNVIATQCENICSIHLSAEELKGVWFGE